MSKAYLAHSSKNKCFIEPIANKLGPQRCVYDKLTFEEGMITVEEIAKALNQTDIFVLFISSDALESEWVKTELSKALNLKLEGFIKKIYPIIIDPEVTQFDKRIPLWLREGYNLQYCGKTSAAINKIDQKLRETKINFDPTAKERSNLFIGRNDLVGVFERRYGLFDSEPLACLNAGGIRGLGRRSFCLHCIKKVNIVGPAYIPPSISLSRSDSIEDFILKVYDLHFSSGYDLADLMKKTIEEKIAISLKLIKDLMDAKQVLLIIDEGCIVVAERTIAPWFKQILSKINQFTFLLVSYFRPLLHKNYDIKNLSSIDIPELSLSERLSLLKIYSDMEGLKLSATDINYFRDILHGYPEQIFFTVMLIKDFGLDGVKDKEKINMIVEYNSERSAILVNRYEKNEKALDFLCLLARFDIIKYSLVFEIVGEDADHKNLLEEFLACGLCDLVGANREYIKLNDTLRDYISRNRFQLPQGYADKLAKHLNDFLGSYNPENEDVASFFYKVREALITGKEIKDESFLIPSHYLNAIEELYHKKNNEDVISLSDRVLDNEKYLDDNIKKEIRMFLCLSLAKKQDQRFFSEVDKVTGAQHEFLLGFYYRHKGLGTLAIKHYRNALQKYTGYRSAKRELVWALNFVEDYEGALDLAKENYEMEKDNPFHIDAYFQALIKREPKNKEQLVKFDELISGMDRLKTDQAEQFRYNMKAQYEAFINDNKVRALSIIDDGLKIIENKLYLKMTKFDIYEKFVDMPGMAAVVKELDEEINNKSPFYIQLVRRKITLFAFQKDEQRARDLLGANQARMPEEVNRKLSDKIEKIFTQFK